jgi:hypothetical protein
VRAEQQQQQQQQQQQLQQPARSNTPLRCPTCPPPALTRHATPHPSACPAAGKAQGKAKGKATQQEGGKRRRPPLALGTAIMEGEFAEAVAGLVLQAAGACLDRCARRCWLLAAAGCCC